MPPSGGCMGPLAPTGIVLYTSLIVIHFPLLLTTNAISDGNIKKITFEVYVSYLSALYSFLYIFKNF